MLRAIRVHALVDSDVLRIPELLPFVGRTVEVIILHEAPAGAAETPRRAPRLGTLRGQVDVPDDFDAPLPSACTPGSTRRS
jgi:hypothetical protein